MYEKFLHSIDPRTNQDLLPLLTTTSSTTSTATTTSATTSVAESDSSLPATDSDLGVALRLAPCALTIIFENSALEMQRLALLQQLQLIYTNVNQPITHYFNCHESTLSATSPSKYQYKVIYALFAVDLSSSHPDSSNNRTRQLTAVKEAVLSLRVDEEFLRDFLVDINSKYEPLPSKAELEEILQLQLQDRNSAQENAEKNASPLQGLVCSNLLRAALEVLREVFPSILQLLAGQYQLQVVGHSLGGAIASLVTLLLHQLLHPSSEHLLRGVVYSCPAIVSQSLAVTACNNAQNNAQTNASNNNALLRRLILNVIVKNDCVCRMSVASIRAFLRSLVDFRKYVFMHAKQDCEAVLARALQISVARRRYFEDFYQDNEQGRAQPAGAGSAKQQLALPYDLEASSTSSSTASSTAREDFQLVSASAEEIEEEVRLFPPGKILHLFFHRGQTLAAEVRGDFNELCELQLEANMMRDHRRSAVFNALLEARAARVHYYNLREPTSSSATGYPASRPELPEWTPFDRASACSCCKNSFTWHSSLQTSLQEFREKHHCRCCGKCTIFNCIFNLTVVDACMSIVGQLVCGPCSQQRRSILKLGMLFEVRICDKCSLNAAFT